MHRFAKIGIVALCVILAAAACLALLSIRNDGGSKANLVALPHGVDPEIAELILQSADAAHATPQDIDALAKLAMVYHANGFNSLAIETYQKALKLDSESGKLWYHLARAQVAQDDLDAARQSFQSAIRFEPNNVALHRQYGYCLLDLNEPDAAQQSFSRALQLDVSDVASHIGMVLIKLGNRENDKAAVVLNELLERAPSSASYIPYLRQLRSLAIRGGGAPTPLSHQPNATGLQNTWPDPWADEVDRWRTGYRAYLERIQLLLAGGKPQEALQLAERVLVRRPNDLGAQNYKAAALFALQRWDEGIAVLEGALRLDPKHYATHLNLARGYEGRQEFDQALIHARAAIEFNPTFAEARTREAELLIHEDRLEEAADSLRQAAKLAPADIETHLLLASTLARISKCDEASTVLRQVVELAPDSADIQVKLAIALAECGQFQEAQEFLARARSNDPSVPGLAEAITRIRRLESQARTTNSQ